MRNIWICTDSLQENETKKPYNSNLISQVILLVIKTILQFLEI